MSEDHDMFYCSFVSIHYIICECGETFPTEEELKSHLERDHAQKKDIKEYKCGVCEAIFNTEELCIKHYESTHIEIKEEHDYVEADEEGYVEADEQGYMEADEQGYEGTEEHDYVEVEPAGEGSEGQEIVLVKPTQLAYIIEKGPRKQAVQPETKVRVKKEKDKEKKKAYHNIKNIVCEVCGKRYASNAALKYHQRVHTGERPYKCTDCTKSFTMPLFLQIHMRTHTGERPYECSTCPKAFSNKAALLRHDRVHTGIKPYECPQCGKFFTQSNSMKLHVNTVHLKMPAPYKSKTRRNKAKERQILREAILRVIDQTEEEHDNVEAINTKQDPSLVEAELSFVKQEQEIEEQEILYEDVDSREITYEVIYED